MPHPAAAPLSVSEVDRTALRALVRASTSEQRAVTRARIVLRSADGIAIERVAAELGAASASHRRMSASQSVCRRGSA